LNKGRPLKYDKVLMALEDDALYTPADIADLAMAMGIGSKHPDANQKLAYTRVRITMGRFGKNHNFPMEGDGMIKRKGQAPTPAWLGRRWKEKPLLSRQRPSKQPENSSGKTAAAQSMEKELTQQQKEARFAEWLKRRTEEEQNHTADSI